MPYHDHHDPELATENANLDSIFQGNKVVVIGARDLNTINQLPLLTLTIDGNIKRESLLTVVHSVSPTSVVHMQGVPAKPIRPPQPP